MKTTDLRKNRGFTLVELMIVVAIIIILVGIAIPVFGEVINRGRAAQLLSNFDSLARDLEHYKQDWGVYPNPVNPAEEFGYSVDRETPTSLLSRELLGINSIKNKHGNKTFLGEDGGIEYILRPQILQNMQNPFGKDYKLYYGSKDGGSYVLYAELPNGKYIVRYPNTSSEITTNLPSVP
ncbi:type IV pilin protein [Caldisericum exile]|uniref:Fimbrial protein n=1 Tax=Caldisericum exile (strain DSM 21853 / NBRC 104410 / AZM16c01) TaxID=511051 RepID=A0A7U6JFE3_CALEA|nr:prepilin-type N-terminal cleavage/methylation domain-containing protein [Caldisericum exile]BAL81696.1 putative fimbrial protein [Caldisericum exile AZM16c01]